MPSITPHDAAIIEVAGGVDTHQDTHTAAVIDQVGRVLGTRQFPAGVAGYAALLAWMRSFGQLGRVGVEGTGAYGAGLARFLRRQDIEVIEVDRPDRKTRRFQGKSDPIDAIQAAKTALAGQRTGVPKQRDGLNDEVARLQLEAYGHTLKNWFIDLDHHFGGFAKRKPELDAFIADFRARHGITLGWVYVAKMMYSIYDLPTKAFSSQAR